MMRALPATLAILALSACAPTPKQQAAIARQDASDQQRLDAALRGLRPGSTSSCLPIQTGSSTTTGYGATILYRISPGRVYRTETTGGCEGLSRSDDILVTVSNQGRPCHGDIARTIDRSTRFPTGSCALGDFTEYRKGK